MYRRDSPFHVDKRSHTGTITPQYRYPEKILQDIRKRIDDAAIKQEKLSKSRENLLVKRERTRVSGKKVQAKRSEAGDAEAAFMDHIRNFMNTATTPSFQMIDLFNKVESARNELGAMEADYQQLERSLTGADWMFKEEEDEFYQYGLPELFEDVFEGANLRPQDTAIPILPHRQSAPPPPPPILSLGHVDTDPPQIPRYPPQRPPPPPLPLPRFADSAQSAFVSRSHPSESLSPPDRSFPLPHIIEPDLGSDRKSKIELDGLGKQFGSVSHLGTSPLGYNDISIPDSLSVPELGSSFSFPASTILASETYSQGLGPSWCSEAETANGTYLAPYMSLTGRRYSDPITYGDEEFTTPQTLERSLSENAISDVHRGRAAKNRVRIWLMSLLKHNPMEKALYHNILEATLEKYGYHYPDHEPWGIPATQYWGRDSRSSFETDPLDKSTTALGTIQDARLADTPALLVGESLRTPPLGSSLFELEIKTMQPEALVATNRDEDVDLDPANSPLPPSPITSSNGTAVPPHGKKLALQAKSHSSSLNLPKITIACPQDDEDTILSQAASKPLPPSPIHLSWGPARWRQYGLDMSSSTPRSETTQRVSYRDLVRNLILPSKKKRSHSMSSVALPRQTTYSIKRTLSKDRT